MHSKVDRSKLEIYTLLMGEPALKSQTVQRGSVTVRVAKTHANLNAHAAQVLKSHSDLTLVEWRVIQLLSLYKEAPMSIIASELQIDKGQLSRRLSAMTAKGLVTSSPDANDQRKFILRLTGQSLTYVRKLSPIMDKLQSDLQAGVSDSDLDTFYRVLARFDANATKRGSA